MKDWLGNDLEVGTTIVYSSTSTFSVMNLGEIETLTENRIQVRIWRVSARTWSRGNLITLRRGQSAFKSVTRYQGVFPEGADA